jgi:hypothetical protein
MSGLVKSLIRTCSIVENPFWERAAERPTEVQHAVLLRILRRNADTEFGRAHGFREIHTQHEFRNRVPIQDFEGFRSYMKRVMEGAPSVLTTERPVVFTVTSGTMAEPKYIPVTPQGLKDEFAALRRWYYGALRDHPDFLDHARLAIVGAPTEGMTSCGIPFGSASGMVFGRIPGWLRAKYAVPDGVAEIKDYHARYLVLARFALCHRLSFLVTANPSTLLRLASVIEQHTESLIRAVHDGTLGSDVTGEPPELTKRLTSTLRPYPERARALARIVEQLGALRPAECWPDLQLIGCWLGGSVGVQANKLPSYFGDVPLRDVGYMASEGHFSVPDQDHVPSGLLTLRTSFYEFIPEDTLEGSNPEVLSCAEVEAGKRYRLVVTTANGLYRYDIQDIIEVAGFYRQTPAIAFVRKAGEMTSLTGEKLHVNQVVAAFETMRARFALSVVQFRMAPDVNAMRYLVYVELDSERDVKAIDAHVIHTFDEELGKINMEYAQKRRSQRLLLPQIHIMRNGWAEAERERFFRSGKRDVQFKWKVLVPEPSPDDSRHVIATVFG